MARWVAKSEARAERRRHSVAGLGPPHRSAGAAGAGSRYMLRRHALQAAVHRVLLALLSAGPRAGRAPCDSRLGWSLVRGVLRPAADVDLPLRIRAGRADHAQSERDQR